MITNFPDAIRPYKPSGGTNAIIFFEGGVNDLATDGIETVWQRITNFWALAKSDGFSLCAFTIPDNIQMPASNRLYVDTINARIKASTVWDYCVDIRSVWGDANSSSECLNGVHWTTNACILLAIEANEALKGKKPTVTDSKFLTTNLQVYNWLISGFIVNRYSIVSTNGTSYRSGWSNFRAGGPYPSYAWGNETGPMAEAKLTAGDLGFYLTSASNFLASHLVLNMNTNGVFMKEASAGRMRATNGYLLPSNAVSAWPTTARTPGEIAIVNSNGYAFMLESHPGATAWVSTNPVSHQPKWIDVAVAGTEARLGASSPQRTLIMENIYGQGWDSTDDADFTMQLPHGVALTNAWFPNFYFIPHLHISVIATNAGANVAFKMSYQYAKGDGAFSQVYNVTNFVSFTQTNTLKFLEFTPHTNNALSGADSLVIRGNIRCLTNTTGARVILDSADFHVPVVRYGNYGY